MANNIINNRQVNIWRGADTPPTIYHVWVKDDSQLLLYDGTEWRVFVDNIEITETLSKIMEHLDNLDKTVADLGNKTVNGKPIKTNPVLNGTDLLLTKDGNYVSRADSITNSILTVDYMLRTQIIE